MLSFVIGFFFPCCITEYIPLYEHTILCLSIHWLMDIWHSFMYLTDHLYLSIIFKCLSDLLPIFNWAVCPFAS